MENGGGERGEQAEGALFSTAFRQTVEKREEIVWSGLPGVASQICDQARQPPANVFCPFRASLT